MNTDIFSSVKKALSINGLLIPLIVSMIVMETGFSIIKILKKKKEKEKELGCTISMTEAEYYLKEDRLIQNHQELSVFIDNYFIKKYGTPCP